MKRLLLPLLCCQLSCSLITNFEEPDKVEDSFESCRDHGDNDGDGLVDCDDPSCAVYNICKELTPEACKDGVDNDGDELVDCQDPGCSKGLKLAYCNREQSCADGKDDDKDGKIDCQDADCAKDTACLESSDTTCADGKDNDLDGLVDCADFGCYASSACCTLPAVDFSGPAFAYKSDCTITKCDSDLTCCKQTTSFNKCCSGTLHCHGFDPGRWVVWGLPRFRQENGAAVANEPCTCDVSGLASVERVRLKPGLKLAFNLTVTRSTTSIDRVCVGLSSADTFPDEQTQCSGVSKPALLAGVCLEVKTVGSAPADSGPPDGKVADGAADGKPKDGKPKDGKLKDGKPKDGKPKDALAADTKPKDAPAADAKPKDAAPDASPAPDSGVPKPASLQADVWVRSVVDGQVMLGQAVTQAGPHKGSVSINNDGKVVMTIGPLSHTSQTPLDVSVRTGLVMIYGHGVSARISDLKITNPATSKRCRAPDAWLRHLMRGAPVIGKDTNVASAGDPSVIKAPSGELLMALSASGSREKPGGIFIATSKTGREFNLEHKGEIKPAMEEGKGTFGHKLGTPLLFHDGKEYLLWYGSTKSKSGGRRGIALATSKDGHAWTRYVGPKKDVVFVLPPNPDAKAWDSGTVKDPTVTRDAKAYLHMWYTGDVWYPGVLNTVPGPAIGYAVSKDGGRTWERKGKVTLAAAVSVKDDPTMGREAPMVVRDEASGHFLMWFTHRSFGEPSTIRHAVSKDGVTWRVWPRVALGNGPPGTFDERGVLSPAVLRDKDRIKMWFAGVNSQGVEQIGYVENRGGQ